MINNGLLLGGGGKKLPLVLANGLSSEQDIHYMYWLSDVVKCSDEDDDDDNDDDDVGHGDSGGDDDHFMTSIWWWELKDTGKHRNASFHQAGPRFNNHSHFHCDIDDFWW